MGYERGEDPTVSFNNVHVEKETDKALLCRIDGSEYWIPKSHVHDDSEVYDEDDHADGTLVITEWLARQKDLL